MTTDLYANISIQDGQQVDSEFLNNGPRFQRAMVSDQFLEKLIGGVANTGIVAPDFGGQNGANAPTLWSYAVSPGAAYLRSGSGNDKIQIAPGTLLQKIANSDGADSTLVAYTFAGTEEFGPIASGGGVDARVDLLQMKLEYITDTSVSVDFQDSSTRAITTVASTTRRRIQCTLSVKQGTAASSPAIPDPDAGYAPVGMVFVGASWTSASAPTFAGDSGAGTGTAQVHDLRMPLVVRAFRVDPVLFKLETAWALSSSNQIALSSNATNKMFVSCQSGPGRILGIAIETSSASLSVAPQLGLMSNAITSAPSTAFTLVHSLSGGGALLNTPLLRYSRRDFEAHHAPAAGPHIQESATNKIGVPIWTNGYHVPQDDTSGDFFGHAGVGFVNQPNGQTIGGVTFYVAVGL